jgi:hypothetical protein
MLDYQQGGARLRIRKSHEGGRCCETPAGGRQYHVASSYIHRAPRIRRAIEFVQRCQFMFKAGSCPSIERTKIRPASAFGIGAPRFTHHSSRMLPDALVITIIQPDGEASYQLEFGQRRFQPVPEERVPKRRANPCKKLNADW